MGSGLNGQDQLLSDVSVLIACLLAVATLYNSPEFRRMGSCLTFLGDPAKMVDEQTEDKLITRDWLAIERTKLANERTFLAYFRTGAAFLAAGVTILHLDLLSDVRAMGWVLCAIAPVILALGTYRFFRVDRGIRRYYTIAKSDIQELP